MLRLSIIPLALLALLAGAMAWSSRGQGRPADFTFVNRGDNKTLDLGVMSWNMDIRIAYALWEGLFTPDPVTFKPIPGVADRMEASPDKRVFTFHLREGARWSDGHDVTTADFVFGWRRMLEQPGEYTYLFEYIRGAKEYELAYDGWKKAIGAGAKSPPAPDFSTVGIEALGPRVLRVSLKNPVPFFTSLCAFPSFFPQDRRCMQPFAQMDPTGTYVASYDQAFTRPPHLVSNGPYRLAEWSFKRRIRMVANNYYWNRANVKSRVIDQLSADDQLAAFRLYESGHADWLPEVDADLSADLVALGRTDIKNFPNFATYFYDFNCDERLSDGTRNPFADRRVRRAFVMAVDKRPIVENVTRCGEPIATTLVPRGVFADYPAPPGLGYNAAEAKRLLAEAGYPNGAGFPHLHILFNNDFPEHAQIAQVCRRQWQINLGVELELEGVEVKVFGDRLHSHEFALGRASWYGDYMDPSTFTDVFKSTSDNNDSNWRKPEYDALLAQAAAEPDERRRMKLLAQAENMLLEDAPVMPIYQYVGHYMFRGNVHGIALDTRQMIMMSAVKVDR